MSTSPQPESAASKPSQFEFDARHNQIMEKLSRDMRWVAAPLLLLGVLYAIAVVSAVVRGFQKPELFLSAVFIALPMLFYFALSSWTRRASESFHRVASTAGQDINHLMVALENLGKKYSLLSLIVKLYVVLIIVAMLAAVILALTGKFAT